MDMIEEYEERKRLRRSRSRWRIFAGLACLIAVAVIWSQRSEPVGKHIARVVVDGVIVDDPKRDTLLRDIADDDSVKAVIVSIDSPGGTVVGSEILYGSLREIAEKKPMVATMRNVAASGGYIAAIAADHIIARGNTITGSVGVIAQMPNAHELFDKVGIDMLEIRSGRLKAQPSVFNPVDPDVVAAKEDMIADSFAWFLGLVEDRRDLSPAAFDSIKAGGIFTGRQAKEIALIDGIGGEEEARTWLEDERAVSADLKILDYGRPPVGLLAAFGDFIGFDPTSTGFASSGLFAIYR